MTKIDLHATILEDGARGAFMKYFLTKEDAFKQEEISLEKDSNYVMDYTTVETYVGSKHHRNAIRNSEEINQ